jgi:molecular chaperone GrpE
VSDETLTVDDTQASGEPAGATPPAADPTTTTDAAEVPAPPGADEGGDELARVTAERDDYLETLRRVQAEFENFRKRVRRDADGERDRAVAAVMDRLLPVLDAFDAARAHHPEALAPLDGVLHPALVALGVERIDPLGEPFDPEAHEAVAINVDDEAAAGGERVVEVLRAGYRCRGRLLRPAMVRVGEELPSEE